jgi:hypothetical protein
MKNIILFFLFMLFSIIGSSQTLHLKTRKHDAVGGKQFAISISDTTLSLQEREKIIYKEIKKGNVPDFLRKLHQIKEVIKLDSQNYELKYYVLPDYFAIGNNDDFIYVPMTPILAQRVANITKCSLPTKIMVNQIYTNAEIKLVPQPIPPTKAMITVPIFINHTDSVISQLRPYWDLHKNGALTSGNKKDIIISNKIYGESSARVVIYGWHKLDGKPIQPVYNKHVNTWADYSHGIRLVQNKIYVNQKKTSLKKILRDVKLNRLISDEGTIEKPFYPVFKSY